MGFADPIAAGNPAALIVAALQSPNYAAGVAGWTVNLDGSVEFNNAVLRGGAQSPNYVPGVSGWAIKTDGSVEFNAGVFRGSTLTIGTAPNLIQLSDQGSAATIQLATPSFPLGTVAPYGSRLYCSEGATSGQGSAILISPARSGAGQTSAVVGATSSGTNPTANPSEIDLNADNVIAFASLAQIQGPSALADLATIWAWSAPLLNGPVGARRIFLTQVGSAVVTLGGGNGTANVALPAGFPTGVLVVVPVNGDGGAFTGTVSIFGAVALNAFNVICKTATGGIPANGTVMRVNWLAFGW